MEVYNMKKATVRSLTAKGYSQKKIALTLHIRKSKVVAAQKALGVGKRVSHPFWRDVKGIMEMKEVSRKEAIKEVKFTPKWFKKRQARLKGVDKARDAMREKWQRINEGKIDMSIFEEKEGEELMESAQYD
jgi:hypothetical protein